MSFPCLINYGTDGGLRGPWPHSHRLATTIWTPPHVRLAIARREHHRRAWEIAIQPALNDPARNFAGRPPHLRLPVPMGARNPVRLRCVHGWNRRLRFVPGRPSMRNCRPLLPG